MKTYSSSHSKIHGRAMARRSGFTLVEILVAVAIMSLLLTIILVPLRLGFETFSIGTTRSSLQQEVQLTMQQIGRDFSRANFVFPNTRIPDISDSNDSTSPCSLQPYNSNGTGSVTDWRRLPYFKSETVPGSNSDPSTSGIGVTNTSSSLKPIANPTRIDMLLLRRTTSAVTAPGVTNLFPPEVGEDYVVSYYPRRVNIARPYDVIENPIVLFRAQYPYRYYEGSTASTARFAPFPSTTNPTSAVNAEIDWSKYPTTLGSSTANTTTDRSFLWITHNYFGEANLEPLTRDVTSGVAAQENVPRSHVLAIPRGMQLVAPKANTSESGAYMPELSFVEASSNGKRIDRVTVSMTLAQYDQAGAATVNGQGRAQRVPITQTFDLPNAGCSK